jgi:hypothetical protein
MRAFAIALVLVGCAPPDAHQVAAVVVPAIGQPMGTFPSAAERLGIMAINRGRSDPATVKGAMSQLYPARPPVLWSYELSRSSRFHARNLLVSNVTLMHSSPCPLNSNVATADCDGAVACACASPVPTMCASCAGVAAVNTCGTMPFTRIGYFTSGTNTSANGEVAAAGYSDPFATVDGWLDEAMGNDGHRRNLLDADMTSDVMGFGNAADTSGCYSSFDVSDSGNAGVTLPKLPTAAVMPVGGDAGMYTFYATWNDPSLGAPHAINVVVDGMCSTMTRELGQDNLNATYKATAQLAAGCHSYWILASDGMGARISYPTTGAPTISVGGTACAGDFLASAPAATCDSAPPGSDGGGGSGGGAHDLGLTGGGSRDFGGTGAFDLGGGALDLTQNGGAEPPGRALPGCSCSIGVSRSRSAPLGLVCLVLLAIVLARSLRRRGP